ncbi:MAG TPA: hypothetical protein VFZ56_06680 [Gemmatimonadaceae bacterium]
MSSRLRLSLTLLTVAPLVGAGAGAQQRTRVEVTLPPASLVAVEGPRVSSDRLLTDGRVHDLLVNGFPARVRYTVERWAVKRWFDDLRASIEWDVIVRHDPLRNVFRVIRVRGDEAVVVGSYETLAGADSALGAPARSGITPPHRGERSYYALRVDVEMLSVSDLDELERWLRGELRPAVRGDRNPGTALERGARTLLVRVLGGERRRYAARTGKFVP